MRLLVLSLLLTTSAIPAFAHSIESVSIDGQRFRPIPEIMNLPDGAVIPESVYARFDSRLIGASIVTRLHERHEHQSSDHHPEFDYRRDGVIQMAFHPEFIDHHAQYGFQNQHQIMQSDGTMDGALRARVEDVIATVQLEQRYHWGWQSKVNEVRPKYSFLDFLNNDDGQHALFEFPVFEEDAAAQYGDVIAVLKDEVKDRTTFTTSDSLVLDDNGNGALEKGRYTMHYRGAQGLKKAEEALYWEAQIWGSITLADVEMFLINCPRHSSLKEPFLTKLRETGVPMANCRDSADKSHYEATTIISKGDPAAQANYRLPFEGSDTLKLLVGPQP